MKGSGFTLVEVLVALVVLEVGLLGTVGLLVLAARTMTDAEVLERGVAEAEAALDSLAVEGEAGEGGRTWVRGEVRWRVVADGQIAVFVLDGADTLLAVHGWAESPWGAP